MVYYKIFGNIENPVEKTINHSTTQKKTTVNILVTFSLWCIFYLVHFFLHIRMEFPQCQNLFAQYIVKTILV